MSEPARPKVSLRDHYFWSTDGDRTRCCALIDDGDGPLTLVGGRRYRMCFRTAEEHELESQAAATAFYALKDSRNLSDRITYTIRLHGATRIEAGLYSIGGDDGWNSSTCGRLYACCPPKLSGVMAAGEWRFDLESSDYMDGEEDAATLNAWIDDAIARASADGRLPVVDAR
jgi:hypothetical protein